MKITGLIFGNAGTLTKDMLKKDKMDETKTIFEKVPLLDRSTKEKVEKMFLNALPPEVDHSFMQIKSEDQILDLPEADGYVVFPFQLFDDGWLHALYSHGKSIVIAPLPFSEVFSYGNVYYPYFMRDSREIDKLLSLPHHVYLCKNEEDLSLTIKALYVKYKIEKTKVLCIGSPMYEPFHSKDWGYSMVRAIQEKFGLEWFYLSSEKFLKYWNKWEKEIDISDLKNSAREVYFADDEGLKKVKNLYLIFKKLIEERGANALTVNCFSAILPKTHATPCYALSKLNDEEIPSVCEADTTTLIDMLITVYATDSPGSMVNPYLFPSDNRILLSHCTSPTIHSYKRGGEQDEFDFYTYFEQPTLSAGIHVLKQPEAVTITGISEDLLDKMLVISGKIKRNTYFNTCRTQVEIEVDQDVEEIAKNYQGRHWIYVYGDYRKNIKKVNDILGIETIQL